MRTVIAISRFRLESYFDTALVCDYCRLRWILITDGRFHWNCARWESQYGNTVRYLFYWALPTLPPGKSTQATNVPIEETNINFEVISKFRIECLGVLDALLNVLSVDLTRAFVDKVTQIEKYTTISLDDVYRFYRQEWMDHTVQCVNYDLTTIEFLAF